MYTYRYMNSSTLSYTYNYRCSYTCKHTYSYTYRYTYCCNICNFCYIVIPIVMLTGVIIL